MTAISRRLVLAGLGSAPLAMPGIIRAQTTSKPIKIGMLSDMSGPYRDVGGPGNRRAAELAIEDAGGGVLDRPVQVLQADDQNKPDIASSIARSWIDGEDVVMLMDGAGSSAGLAIQQVGREKKRPYLATGPATSDLTGSQCSPFGIHFIYDTYALSHGTGDALTKAGGDTWFFITADYAFGHALERDTAAAVKAAGGKVLGGVRAPLATADFSAYLLQAQASGAKVIGLANAGADTSNAIKQASEFGITQSGQSLAALLIFLTDVNAIGLETAQGLVLTEAFYWDLNDDTRAWSRRFAERHDGDLPTMVQAGVYASVLHYLKAVDATGTKDTEKVMAWMKSNPTKDPLFGEGEIRVDGRHIHDMYLFQVKSPSESTGKWDDYKVLATIPAAEAFRPLADGGCPLVTK